MKKFIFLTVTSLLASSFASAQSLQCTHGLQEVATCQLQAMGTTESDMTGLPMSVKSLVCQQQDSKEIELVTSVENGPSLTAKFVLVGDSYLSRDEAGTLSRLSLDRVSKTLTVSDYSQQGSLLSLFQCIVW